MKPSSVPCSADMIWCLCCCCFSRSPFRTSPKPWREQRFSSLWSRTSLSGNSVTRWSLTLLREPSASRWSKWDPVTWHCFLFLCGYSVMRFCSWAMFPKISLCGDAGCRWGTRRTEAHLRHHQRKTRDRRQRPDGGQHRKRGGGWAVLWNHHRLDAVKSKMVWRWQRWSYFVGILFK